MNDFTKEELMNIADAILYSSLIESRGNVLIPIRNKLQSLINNYCEHDWENICCQCSMDNVYCHKCEKRFTDE